MDAEQLDPGLNGEVRQRAGQQRPQALGGNQLVLALLINYDRENCLINVGTEGNTGILRIVLCGLRSATRVRHFETRSIYHWKTTDRTRVITFPDQPPLPY